MPGNDSLPPTEAWAKSQLTKLPHSETDWSRTWCRYLQRQAAEATLQDWLAYRALEGDQQAWPALTSSNLPAIANWQWNQLHQFEEDFVELDRRDKLSRYEMLMAHLQDNAAAKARLLRYQPLLDLEPGGATLSPDARLFARELVAISVCGPIKRQEAISFLFDVSFSEPVRWQKAAQEILAHPRYGSIEPQITQHIAKMLWLDHPDPDRLRTRDRAFRRRFGSQVLLHKFRHLVPRVAMLVALTIVVGVLVVAAGAPRRAGRNHRLVNVLPKEVQVAVNVADRHAIANSRASQPVPFQPDPMVFDCWRSIAETHGLNGLTLLESTLGDKIAFEVDHGRGEHEAIYRGYLSLLREWREREGNRLANQSEGSKESLP